jgi:Carboxypeptidase regulatory-like domain
MKKVLILFGAISLCFVFAARARVLVGTLAGTVVDAHGHPVAGAAVSIQSSDGLEPYGAHTDRSGHFHIARLETGQYDLRASYHGATSDWTRRVAVHSNKTTEVRLLLPPGRS